jgi:hypothetical protein
MSIRVDESEMEGKEASRKSALFRLRMKRVQSSGLEVTKDNKNRSHSLSSPRHLLLLEEKNCPGGLIDGKIFPSKQLGRRCWMEWTILRLTLVWPTTKERKSYKRWSILSCQNRHRSTLQYIQWCVVPLVFGESNWLWNGERHTKINQSNTNQKRTHAQLVCYHNQSNHHGPRRRRRS